MLQGSSKGFALRSNPIRHMPANMLKLLSQPWDFALTLSRCKPNGATQYAAPNSKPVKQAGVFCLGDDKRSCNAERYTKTCIKRITRSQRCKPYQGRGVCKQLTLSVKCHPRRSKCCAGGVFKMYSTRLAKMKAKGPAAVVKPKLASDALKSCPTPKAAIKYAPNLAEPTCLSKIRKLYCRRRPKIVSPGCRKATGLSSGPITLLFAREVCKISEPAADMIKTSFAKGAPEKPVVISETEALFHC